MEDEEGGETTEKGAGNITMDVYGIEIEAAENLEVELELEVKGGDGVEG